MKTISDEDWQRELTRARHQPNKLRQKIREVLDKKKPTVIGGLYFMQGGI